MNHKTAFFICLAILPLFSCVEGPQAIFYTIENETPTTDKSLPNDITVFTVTKSDGAYYIPGGSIWMKTLLENEWKKVSNALSENSESDALSFCNNLVFFNGYLFGAFFSTSESTARTYGLFRSQPPSSSGTDIVLTWELADDSNVKDKQIVYLKQINGTHLFACVAEISQANPSIFAYTLYVSTDGSTFTSGGLNSIPNPVLDIEFDTSSSTYWVITSNIIYTGTDITNLQQTSIPTASSNGVHDYAGAYYSSSFSALYVASKSGFIYRYSDENWSESQVVEESSRAVRFTDLSEIPNRVIVGTEGYGYYEIADGDITTIQRFAGVTKTDLYHGVVLRFFLDSIDSTTMVYACTSRNGLWFGEYGDSDTLEWNRE